MVDENNRLLGILTARDYRFRSDDSLVEDIMQRDQHLPQHLARDEKVPQIRPAVGVGQV